MKNIALILTTVIFFLIINTRYYWESELGLLAFPAFLFLVLFYFLLVILLLFQILVTFRDRLTNKLNIFTLVLLTIVLTVTFIKPGGLINFDKLEGNDILVAEREGAANCMTTFKLKENNKFIETKVCFCISEIKGIYTIKNYTIYFEKVELGRLEKEFYKFAVIRPSRFDRENKTFDLVRFKDKYDTIGHELWITKNDLYAKTKSRTANNTYTKSGR